jgi:DNA-binding MarR family transcriptional regulator
MLKRLEGLGLITRAKNAADERATDVRLAESGIALRERALAIPPAVVARLGVEVAELENLHQVLTRINSAALAAGALQS